MRFLADENFPGPVLRALRSIGHDVASVRETHRSAADREVLRVAKTERRVLPTCDKDFGQLALASALPPECGVVLFRLGGADPRRDNERMVRVIADREDWTAHFAVVTDVRVRLRPLAARPR